ncbi:toxin co-regulated pilus biosynthesis Q family protein [Xanthomonas euvesicatoria pv. eucalypti]|uniref:toxin co-regulated pilus biosynthesis Q family protein n=1 Tax=Xanthomonas euvesicatoria TaxID=456327 RepID=UPI0026E49301|nr:toxin co-regulated pilus biosynthesis Q family protein [Xanthomonas euvesicatoria]MDO7931486.1 toxin co-regulated pilus biosynthesis Q family protein [Xanthomonas euvesicatoria pv. eucalypti]MDO7935787.1 toxin co-regulated pilus biosynthesis Q family protein [Xanthomonas euvesicatoria pv. eucalypti]MDO7940127.1 toxin co-regulated pilus biosynthesis Q family protein [Xanthomonas euvesicatoria pv. eucalypti]MDO7944634.1 toxin co-regulated pilus biosynthesis Q family protein [Xanthomonas euvesi
MKKGSSSLFACLALAVSTPALAGFRVSQPEPAPKPADSATTSAPSQAPRSGYVAIDGKDPPSIAEALRPSSAGFGLVAVSYVGTPPAVIERRAGMGRDVRLADALKQIAPEGWRGFGKSEIAGSFDPNRLVNWRGGRPWTDVLDILANEQDLSVEVDWNKRHLYVGKRDYNAAGAGAAVAASATRNAAAPTPAPYQVKQVWTAKAGSTVRETVEQWAKTQAWTVYWPMQDLDYRIVAPLTFDGSLVDAVSKLTLLYESAQRPLAVGIFVNQKLIRYSEKEAAQ